MDRAKEYLDNYKNLNQEIRSYSAQLELKYDEFGRKIDEAEESGRSSSAWSYVGAWFDNLVRKVRLSRVSSQE